MTSKHTRATAPDLILRRRSAQERDASKSTGTQYLSTWAPGGGALPAIGRTGVFSSSAHFVCRSSREGRDGAGLLIFVHRRKPSDGSKIEQAGTTPNELTHPPQADVPVLPDGRAQRQARLDWCTSQPDRAAIHPVPGNTLSRPEHQRHVRQRCASVARIHPPRHRIPACGFDMVPRRIFTAVPFTARSQQPRENRVDEVVLVLAYNPSDATRAWNSSTVNSGASSM